MAYQNPWPQWLKNKIPSWLESTGYPQSGVGDLRDLKFNISTGSQGKWLGFVNTGYFYHNNREQYKFVVPNQVTYTFQPHTTGTLIEPISFRPAWGPVLLTSDASGGPYTQHSNGFQPGTVQTWTQIGTGSLYYTYLATGCIVTGARNYTTLPLGQVNASGAVTSNYLYFYDPLQQLVIIKPKDPTNIDVFLDIAWQSPILRFRELVIIESDFSLKPSYITYYPLEDMHTIRGTQLVTLGSVGSSFTCPLTGCAVGDWVVLDYWIPGSYCMPAHNTLQYYTFPISGDTVTLTYETSIPDLIPPITLTAPTSSLSFNLNTIYPDGYRAGFLFHSIITSGFNSYFTPKHLYAYLDKDTLISDFKEYTKYNLRLYGDNNLPLANYPVAINYTANASVVIASPVASGFYTDNKGEINILFAPAYGGSSFTVNALASGNGIVLTVTASASIVALNTIVNQNNWVDGFNHIVITSQKLQSGAYVGYACRTQLDGIPTSATVGNPIIICTKYNSNVIQRTPNGIVQGSQISVTTDATTNLNIGGVTQFEYYPQKGDKIVGLSQNGNGVIEKGDQ